MLATGPRQGRRADDRRPTSTAAPISTQQYHPSVSEGKHEADDMPAAAPVGAGAGAGASQGPQTARQIEADHAIAEQMQREELEAAEGGGGTPPSAVPNYAEQMAAGSYDPGDGEVPHGHTFEGEQRGAGAGAGAAAGQASAAPQTVIESRKFPPCDFRAPSLNPGLCDARDHGDKKDFKIYQESIDERLEEAVPTTPAEVALTVAAGPVAGKAAQVMKPVVEPLVKPLVKKAAPHVAKVKKALGDRVAGLAGKVMPKASSASAKPKSVVNNGKLPAEPKLKGMRNPKVREAVEKGQQKHKEFAEKVKQKPGWKSEEPHFDKSGKKYIPDATTPSGKLIELKPKTASGVKKGKLQMEKYEDVTGKKGKVVYYDD